MKLSRHLARLKNGSCIKAATDDVIAVLKVSTEEELCASVRNICGLMNDGAADVGLSFANHKALLLYLKACLSNALTCYPLVSVFVPTRLKILS
jgi:hypothetical protein